MDCFSGDYWAFLGKWLDQKFGTDPWLFLGTIAFCFFVSMYGLVVNALKEFKKIETEFQAKKGQTTKNENNLNNK